MRTPNGAPSPRASIGASSAYCWPREAIWVGGSLARLGHPAMDRAVYLWLNRVRHRHRPFLYWFQKYSIDGVPEWETPGSPVGDDPLGAGAHYRRSADRELVSSVWPMVEQAANVCCGTPSGHPGLRWLDDLSLLSSAGVGDQVFGAFLYTNATAVAGLRAASRLAAELGLEESSRRWTGCADRIWNRGILGELVSLRSDGPGGADPETGRFYQARRVSRLRGLWTDDPKHLVDRSELLEIFMLGMAVPFGLLPASTPGGADRRVDIAEQCRPQGGFPAPGPHDVRSRAGRRIRRSARGLQHRDALDGPLPDPARSRDGSGPALDAGVGMFEAILGRLSKLGLGLRSSPVAAIRAARRQLGGTAWRLHSMLIDAMLDLAGLDYDAVARRLTLQPVLPGPWPQTGIKQTFACGEVSYLLQRPIGGRVHHLELKTRLDHPVNLEVNLTCPELKELGPWQSSSPMPEPTFDGRTGRIRGSRPCPRGEGNGAGRGAESWPQGGRFAQEGLVKPTDVVCRSRPSQSQIPRNRRAAPPLFEVMAEEPVADRPCSVHRSGPGIPFPDDPSRTIIGLDHLDVTLAGDADGLQTESRSENVGGRRRDREGCRGARVVPRLATIVRERRGLSIAGFRPVIEVRR